MDISEHHYFTDTLGLCPRNIAGDVTGQTYKKSKSFEVFQDFDDPHVKSILSSVVAKHTMYSELLLSRILDTSSYFFFEGPLEYAIDASLDWIAAAGSLLQAARVKKLGPFRLTSALLNSGVNSLLLLLLSLTFSQHILYNSLSQNFLG